MSNAISGAGRGVELFDRRSDKISASKQITQNSRIGAIQKAILRDEAKVLQGFFGEMTNYRGTLYDGKDFISEHMKDRMKTSAGP
jgi:hypothetical protein